MARKGNDPPCHSKKHNHHDDQGRQAAPERAHVGKELLLSSTVISSITRKRASCCSIRSSWSAWFLACTSKSRWPPGKMGEFGRRLEAAIEQGRQPGQAGQRLTQLKEKFPPRGRGFA
jgi:hypothetical protein